MAFPYPPPSQGDSDHFLFLKIAAALYEIQQGGGGGGGTVTSVGLALPVSVFSISGSPVTTTGTLTGSFTNQTANRVFAGPSTGAAAAPAFRALVAADMVAAGLNTQVQWNNSGSLGADAGLTYAVGNLGVGASGAVAGQLNVNDDGGGGGGSIHLFSSGGFQTILQSIATAMRFVTFPDATGTVLLRETLPSIVQSVKTATDSTTSGSFVAISGLDNAVITTESATDRVLVRAVLQVSQSATNEGSFYRLTRNGTAIGVGDAAGSRIQCGGYSYVAENNYGVRAMVLEWLDTPGSEAAHTYAVQWMTSGGIIAYLNRGVTDTDAAYVGRAASVLTAQLIPTS